MAEQQSLMARIARLVTEYECAASLAHSTSPKYAASLADDVADLRAVLALVRDAREACSRAERQFRFYADQHRDKSPPDYKKAQVNDAEAEALATILARLNAAEGEG